MKRYRQPDAFELIQRHFAPLLFQARMDSPATIQIQILDERSGESLMLAGIPCGIALTEAQIAALIALVEMDIAALCPTLLCSRRVG